MHADTHVSLTARDGTLRPDAGIPPPARPSISSIYARDVQVHRATVATLHTRCNLGFQNPTEGRRLSPQPLNPPKACCRRHV